VKKINWRGREWTIRPATQEERDLHMEDTDGVLFESRSIIIYNPDAPEDVQLQAVLHECGHVMFPEWKTEPHQTSKSELGVFERDMKALLDACDVDLSGLLK